MPFDFAEADARITALYDLKPGISRGNALEDLAADMLASMPGVTVYGRKILDHAGEAEIDIQLSNNGHEDGLPALQRDVLVECKSQGTPLDTRSIDWFVRQLERRRLEHGILVTLAGITGTNENVRAAHSRLAKAAEQGHRVLVLTEDELRAVRSAKHLAAVLEHKRRALVGAFRVATLAKQELLDLDPDSTRIGFGFRGLEHVMRDAGRAVLREMFRAAERMEVPDDTTAAISQAKEQLQRLQAVIDQQKEEPSQDPMWRNVRAELVLTGAVLLDLLSWSPRDEDGRRIIRFELESTAPQNLRAGAGSELWQLLVGYYGERCVASESRHGRNAAALALIKLCLDEIIAIDDIDPRDVYDDLGYEEETYEGF